MKTSIKQIFTLSFFLLISFSAFAEGNCSYRAYKNCYPTHTMGNPNQAMTRALCSVHSDLSEGLFTTESFKSCKSQARYLGQYVKVNFYDFNSGRISSAKVYQ